MAAHKEQWIVSLRALAAVTVVMLHTITGWQDYLKIYPEGIRLLFDNYLMQIFTSNAVPCFIMISGYLLLNPERYMDVKKIKNYIGRMLGILFTFGFCFCLIEELVKAGYQLSFDCIRNAVANLLMGECWAHMWYIYMLIGLYLITPFAKAFVSWADKDMAKFVLSLLFVLTLILPTVLLFFHGKMPQFLPITTPFLFYYLAGYYVPRMSWLQNKAKPLFFIGAAGFLAAIYMRFSGFQISLFCDNFFVGIYGTALFYIAYQNKWLEKIAQNKVVERISFYSLGIYIIHAFYLNILYKFLHFYPDRLPPVIGELAIWMLVILLSFISAFIMARIPVIKKFIV